MDKPVRSWKVLLAVGLLLPPLAYIAGALASNTSDPGPRDAIVITTVDADIAQEPQTVLRARDEDGDELRDCDDDDDDDADDEDSRVVRPCLAGRDFVDDDGDLTDDVSVVEPETETVDRRPEPEGDGGKGGGSGTGGGGDDDDRDRGDDVTVDAPEPDDDTDDVAEGTDDDDAEDGDD